MHPGLLHMLWLMVDGDEAVHVSRQVSKQQIKESRSCRERTLNKETAPKATEPDMTAVIYVFGTLRKYTAKARTRCSRSSPSSPMAVVEVVSYTEVRRTQVGRR